MLQDVCEESMKKVFQIPRFVSKIIFDVVLCVIINGNISCNLAIWPQM